MVITFSKPQKEDLAELTQVMTRAFDDDAQRFLNQNSGGPPGYNNGGFINKWLFQNKESKGIKVECDNKTVGLAIYWINPNGNNVLGNIFIDPKFQSINIGTKLWKQIEAEDKTAKEWTLETPNYAKRNHHFYEKKCGFIKVDEIKDDTPLGVSYVFKKVMNS